jgi:ArsR family transcriptional regulator
MVHHASNGSPPPVRSLANDVAKELVQLFKLFSDETRLRILHYLMQQEELNVRTLCELLGQSQPAVSHHLALLRVAGLIDSRRDGKHNFYRILAGRFQELMEMMFSAGPDQEGRICFEKFFLSYTPVRQLEEQRCQAE